MHGRPSRLATVIVSSPGEPQWLGPCLETLLAHHGGLDPDVVVVENDGSGAAARLVAERYGSGGIRVVECPNHGFGHANNRGLGAVDPATPWVLFLNPDTEVVSGSLENVLRELDAHPRVGAAGLRQIDGDDALLPTMRRFPGVGRALGEALGADGLALPEWLAAPLRLRIVDPSRYDRPSRCDWASGSALLVRRTALDAAGRFDERFFLYAEETDLCRRIVQAGFEVAYTPAMTVRHHVHSGAEPGARMLVQLAYSARLYARKHLAPGRRAAYLAVTAAGVVARRRPGWRRVVRVLLAGGRPPYEPPPPTALRP